MTGTVSPERNVAGTRFRVICGVVSLCLSLVSVYSGFTGALGQGGRDSLTLWVFFAWGAGLAGLSVWLIRGGFKGQPIVLVRERRRILLVLFLAAAVVGLLIYFLTLPNKEQDESWPLMVWTMFPVLFASLPIMLFDRADAREREGPAPMTAGQRRKAGRRLIVLGVSGAFAFALGLVAEIQTEPWWSEGLYRLGIILLSVSAVLAFQLRKARTRKE